MQNFLTINCKFYLTYCKTNIGVSFMDHRAYVNTVDSNSKYSSARSAVKRGRAKHVGYTCGKEDWLMSNVHVYNSRNMHHSNWYIE